MSYQTTIPISLENAIQRIKNVAFLIKELNYRKLEAISSESDIYVKTFIDSEFNKNRANYVTESNIEYWTNSMLESALDSPFYRKSDLENYRIVE
jgi:hypothetical protein